MIHKLPLTTGIIGIVLAAVSGYRWYILFYDPSNALFGIALGLSLFAFSYIYNWMKNADEKFKEQDNRINAIVMWWQKLEHEEIVNQAKGIIK